MDDNANLPVWVAQVTVMPKPGVNDPEGEAILHGLRSLSFADIERVRAGRLIAVHVRAESEEVALERVRLMAERLLANPVIESYAVAVQPVVEEGVVV